MYNIYRDTDGSRKVTPVGNISDMRRFKINEIAGKARTAGVGQWEGLGPWEAETELARVPACCAPSKHV
jgi:hypothetical protein